MSNLSTTKPSEWISRARSVIGARTVYWAGAGNADAQHAGSTLLLVKAGEPAIRTLAHRLQPVPRLDDLENIDYQAPLHLVPQKLLSPFWPTGNLVWSDDAYLIGPERVGQAKVELAKAGVPATSVLTLTGCDCSRFVGWVLGMTQSLSTAALLDDVRSHAPKHFQTLHSAAVGCVAVYPKPKDKRFGHTGFVTALDEAEVPSKFVHCSAENFLQSSDAVQENFTPAFGQHETRWLWPLRAPLP